MPGGPLGPVAETAEQKPPAEEPAPKPPVQRPPPRVVAAAQPVMIVSSPGGATATLDGRSTMACTTPCSLDAAPGRHTIAITMPGYQIEHREVNVGSSPMELPPVVLRAPSGTLMLTSAPSGATVLVNGRRIEQITPAQIQLAPGTYNITVEKDGQRATRTVELRNEIVTLRILLEQ
jgi:hypothetical protein